MLKSNIKQQPYNNLSTWFYASMQINIAFHTSYAKI